MGGDTRTAVERNGSETRAAISTAQGTLHETLESRMAELRGTLAGNHTTALLGQQRGEHATMIAKCDIERQAAENLGKLQLEAAKNASDLAK